MILRSQCRCAQLQPRGTSPCRAAAGPDPLSEGRLPKSNTLLVNWVRDVGRPFSALRSHPMHRSPWAAGSRCHLDSVVDLDNRLRINISFLLLVSLVGKGGLASLVLPIHLPLHHQIHPIMASRRVALVSLGARPSSARCNSVLSTTASTSRLLAKPSPRGFATSVSRASVLATFKTPKVINEPNVSYRGWPWQSRAATSLIPRQEIGKLTNNTAPLCQRFCTERQPVLCSQADEEEGHRGGAHCRWRERGSYRQFCYYFMVSGVGKLTQPPRSKLRPQGSS